MFTKNDILLFVVAIGVPVICSLTMGRNGKFSEKMKIFVCFIFPVLITAYYLYTLGKDIGSILIDSFGALLLFGAINGIIVSQFDKMWEEQKYKEEELERQKEENRELREKLRNKEE